LAEWYEADLRRNPWVGFFVAEKTIMKLNEFLEHANMSQKDFADRVGVTESSISLYMAGKRTPSLKQAIIIENWTRGLVTCKDLLTPPSGDNPEADGA
jgi:transcriptional regulator with XRE-family HTH domain